MDTKKKLKYKYVKNNALSQMDRLKLILNIKAVKKELFAMVLLKVIELERKLFILEMEQGSEVFIPKLLSQDKLPTSFKYYDPIMRVVLLE